MVQWFRLLIVFMAVIWLSACQPMQQGQSRPGQPELIVLGDSNFRVDLTVRPNELWEEYGPRFDLTGMVKQVTSNGKTFLTHSGLSDEFGLHGMGVGGYARTDQGNTFIKMGVGRLYRDTKERYQFDHPYPVVAFAPVRIESQSDRHLTLTQEMDDENYGYAYHKTYHVDPKQAILTINYQITHTGKRPFLIEQYNHNWFDLNNGIVDENYTVQTGFDFQSRSYPWFMQEGRILRIMQPVTGPSYTPCTATSSADDNWVKIANAQSGLNVRYAGSFPVQLLAYYAQSDAVCPEVHMVQFLAGGQTWKWTRTYQFVTP